MTAMHLDHDMRLQAARCMEKEGGSFAGHIARAFYVADTQNAEALLKAFDNLFCKFYMEHLRNERMKGLKQKVFDEYNAIVEAALAKKE
tara:strand:- start:3271 stop:3537 length:267 start_codon:yes stop_codon:yes gene_type:complete